MSVFPKLLSTSLLALSLLLSSSVKGQGEVNGWLRVAPALRINKHWSTEAEGQLRRQSDFPGHLMEYPLLYSARTYLHYDINKRWRLSVSPFAWFRHFSLTDDGYVEKRYEYRFTIATYWLEALNKHIELYNRAALEYREWQGKTDEVRPRWQTGIRWHMAKRLIIKPFNEIVLSYATDKKSLFDQERLGMGFVLALSEKLKTELGFMHIIRKEHNNENVLLSIYYDISN